MPKKKATKNGNGNKTLAKKLAAALRAGARGAQRAGDEALDGQIAAMRLRDKRLGHVLSQCATRAWDLRDMLDAAAKKADSHAK